MIAVFKYLRGCHIEAGISLRIVPGGTTRSKRGKLQKREASQGHERALKMQDRHIKLWEKKKRFSWLTRTAL